MKISLYHINVWALCITIIPQTLMAKSGVGALSDLRMEGGGATVGLGGLILMALFGISCMMFNHLSNERLLIPYWAFGACISYLFFAINWYIKGLPIIPRISSFTEFLTLLFVFGVSGFLMLGPIGFLRGWIKQKLK